MALDIKNFKELAHAYASAQVGAPVAYSFDGKTYSYETLKNAFEAQFSEIAGDFNAYRRNKAQVFELIEVAVDEFLPKKVDAQFAQFAETITLADGDTAIFRTKITEASKKRAKAFVSKVGLAGRYEAFKIAGSTYEIKTNAIGGAAQIAFEDFLEGRVDFTVLVDLVLEGIQEAINKEIYASLGAFVQTIKPIGEGGTRKIATQGFDEDAMDNLLAIADAYGQATIYCTKRFAATMIPAEGWVSNGMKDTMWANGYLGNYKGHNVILLEQSVDENDEFVVPNDTAYILASGSTKPVKIVLEGQTHVKETEQDDWSRHIDMFRKVGVGVVAENTTMCVYINEELSAD